MSTDVAMCSKRSIRRSILLVVAATAARGCASPAPPEPATPAAPPPPLEAKAPARPRLSGLPRARTFEACFADAPVVAVRSGRVYVDGEPVDDVAAVGASGKPHALNAARAALETKADRWKATHPGSRLPGQIVLEIRGDERAAVVKSVFESAALAGYSTAGFGVDPSPATDIVACVTANAFVPSATSETEPVVKRLNVDVNASGPVTIGWSESPSALDRGRSVGGSEVVGISILADALEASWKTQGRRRERSDLRGDALVVVAADDVTLDRIVAVFEAASTTRRGVVFRDGSGGRVSVWSVIFAMP